MSEMSKILNAARPAVEQWLDVAAQFAALRAAAAEQGFDWSRIKAALKAEIEDARRSGARAAKRGGAM